MTDTTRLDSLRALYDAVMAGTLGHDAFCPMWHQDGLCVEADNAYEGSLDAALALHEAVLPGWIWNVVDSETTIWPGYPGDPKDYQTEYAEGNPARSWLLAILSALIAQEAK